MNQSDPLNLSDHEFDAVMTQIDQVIRNRRLSNSGQSSPRLQEAPGLVGRVDRASLSA